MAEIPFTAKRTRPDYYEARQSVDITDTSFPSEPQATWEDASGFQKRSVIIKNTGTGDIVIKVRKRLGEDSDGVFLVDEEDETEVTVASNSQESYESIMAFRYLDFFFHASTNQTAEIIVGAKR